MESQRISTINKVIDRVKTMLNEQNEKMNDMVETEENEDKLKAFSVDQLGIEYMLITCLRNLNALKLEMDRLVVKEQHTTKEDV